MPNTKRGFGSAGLILVILIILGGGAYLWSQKKVEAPAPTNIPADNSFETLPAPTSDTSSWKTYRNDEYGFEFKYPASLTILSKGPNEEQKKIENGETISGTVQPSLETLSFVASNSGSEIFDLVIFPPRNIRSSITPADYTSGYLSLGSTCDTRWISSKPNAVKLTKNGDADMLMVGIADQLCFYLKNQSGNLIVFEKRNPDDIDSYLKDIVLTFRFEPPATSTTLNSTSNNLSPYPVPVVDSISPTSGPVGTEIKISGTNLVEYQGNQQVTIVNSKGELAYFGWGDATGSEIKDANGNFLRWSYLKVKVDPKICKEKGSEAASPCKSWMTITPGKYYIFIDHNNFQGHFESNKIMFTVLSS